MSRRGLPHFYLGVWQSDGNRRPMKIVPAKVASTISNIGLDRLQRLADMSNISFNCVYDFFEVPGEHHLSETQREAHCLRPVGMRRYRESVWIGHYVNERGPRMLQCFLETRGQIRGVFDSYTHHADGFGKLREVWILQVRLKVRKSPGFHLEFHHPQSTVVEHEYLNWEVVLRQCKQVTHEHRETAVATHGYNLASGKGTLGADGLRERVGHGPVVEGTDEPPLLGRLDIAGRPDVAHSGVHGKDRIGRRNFAQSRRHGLRVHGLARSHVVNVHIHFLKLFFVFA